MAAGVFVTVRTLVRVRYLLCSTPRTGSTLLCGLLESTGVAGHPASYFRRPDEDAFAAQWAIPRPSAGTSGYADFLNAALATGTTDNGVFAARIMWGTLEELVERLGTTFPDVAGDDLDLLNQTFARPGSSTCDVTMSWVRRCRCSVPSRLTCGITPMVPSHTG